MSSDDQAHVRWMVDRLGCAIADAESPDGDSRWSYTVGLNGRGTPELVVFGLPRDLSFVLLAELVQAASDGECLLHPCSRPIWESSFGIVYLQRLENPEGYLKRADAWEALRREEWEDEYTGATDRTVYALQIFLEPADPPAPMVAGPGTSVTYDSMAVARSDEDGTGQPW
ncbi:DUF4262 domain-containing protein [Knoellia sp. CPCC 206450]|uniref:DUF4262 domain-containing protein n=1 Tax=Knoellia tibetensis TaxID=3404798 RepID=UPI003B43009F